MDKADRPGLVRVVAQLHLPVVEKHDAELPIFPLIDWLTSRCIVQARLEHIDSADIITQDHRRGQAGRITTFTWGLEYCTSSCFYFCSMSFTCWRRKKSLNCEQCISTACYQKVQMYSLAKLNIWTIFSPLTFNLTILIHKNTVRRSIKVKSYRLQFLGDGKEQQTVEASTWSFEPNWLCEQRKQLSCIGGSNFFVSESQLLNFVQEKWTQLNLQLESTHNSFGYILNLFCISFELEVFILQFINITFLLLWTKSLSKLKKTYKESESNQ